MEQSSKQNQSNIPQKFSEFNSQFQEGEIHPDMNTPGCLQPRPHYHHQSYRSPTPGNNFMYCSCDYEDNLNPDRSFMHQRGFLTSPHVVYPNISKIRTPRSPNNVYLQTQHCSPFSGAYRPTQPYFPTPRWSQGHSAGSSSGISSLPSDSSAKILGSYRSMDSLSSIPNEGSNTNNSQPTNLLAFEGTLNSPSHREPVHFKHKKGPGNLKIGNEQLGTTILDEFASFSSRHGHQTPLSGINLTSQSDGKTAFLKCSKFFSPNAISPLVPFIDQGYGDIRAIGRKMAQYVRDSSVWPVVWTCFARGCSLKYVREDFSTKEYSLYDPVSVDANPHFREFQIHWNTNKDFLIVGINKIESTNPNMSLHSTLQITFGSTPQNKSSYLLVTCPHNHPFFIREKGWCQITPQNSLFKTVESGDLIQQYEEQTSFTFPPPVRSMDYYQQTMASYPEPEHNERMAKMNQEFVPYQPPIYNIQHPAMNDQYWSQIHMSDRHNNPCQAPCSTIPYSVESDKSYMSEDHDCGESKIVGAKSDETSRRPMNGFMLFAKSMRLSFINENPGKDNRVISQLLGKKWRQLKQEEKEKFIVEARLLSMKRMKVNPLCWKRKNPPKKMGKKQSSINRSNVVSDNTEGTRISNDVIPESTITEISMITLGSPKKPETANESHK